jgi:hypothetical protein
LASDNSKLFISVMNSLTPKDPYRGRTVPLTSKVVFYVFIQQIYVLNVFKTWYILSVFSSSKCSLFHNSNVFGSCIIHISYTGVLKFKKIYISAAKMLTNLMHKIFCFTIRLFHASTCSEYVCSSSGGQNCITQPLVSSQL